MKRIYVAGPMRRRPFLGFPAFDEAAERLTAQGWEVVSPADLDREAGHDPATMDVPDDYDWCDLSVIGLDLKGAIRRDVEAILTCDAMFMLKGWDESMGATAERAIAQWLGIPIYYEGKDVDGEEDILEEALRITKGDRQATYGPPDQDFRRTADMWTALFAEKIRGGKDFAPSDVAMAMICLKLSRETHQKKRDNWVDAAGYARCGSLCSE